MNASIQHKQLLVLLLFPVWHILLFGSALLWIDLPVFQTLAHLFALTLPVAIAYFFFQQRTAEFPTNREFSGLSNLRLKALLGLSLLLFGLISVTKWVLLNDFLYESRMTGFSSFLFALNYVSWFFLGFGLYFALLKQRKNLLLISIVFIAVELAFIAFTGVRQDLMLFLLLIFLIVMYVSPDMLTVKRCSAVAFTAIVLLLVMFFSRTQRVDSQVSFQNELTQISSYFTKSAERLYAEPIAFSYAADLTPDSVDFIPSEQFFKTIKTAFTPRFLNQQKPELRPGNEFYQSYMLRSGETSTISFPTGIFTDTYRVWGKWSPLATFVFSVVAVLFWWILFNSGIPAWLSSFIFISEIAVGNHIPFWLTGWIRLTILALLITFFLKLIRKIIESKSQFQKLSR